MLKIYFTDLKLICIYRATLTLPMHYNQIILWGIFLFLLLTCKVSLKLIQIEWIPLFIVCRNYCNVTPAHTDSETLLKHSGKKMICLFFRGFWGLGFRFQFFWGCGFSSYVYWFIWTFGKKYYCNVMCASPHRFRNTAQAFS